MNASKGSLISYIQALLKANEVEAVVLWDDLPKHHAVTAYHALTKRWFFLFDYAKLLEKPRFIVPVILHEIGHAVCHHIDSTADVVAEKEATEWAFGYLRFLNDRANIKNLKALVRTWKSKKAPEQYRAVAKALTIN